MDDNDNLAFVKRYFPDFLRYFLEFPYPIQRADAIRYMFLYVNGGIYIDLDIKILKPLDELFSDRDADVFLVESSNNQKGYYSLTNSIIGGKPRIKFWLECIERMKIPVPFYYFGKHLTIMKSTGPLMVTDAAKKNKNTRIRILPSDKLLPCSACDLECPRSKIADNFAVSLEGGSWHGIDTKIYNFFICNLKEIIGCTIFFIIFFTIFFIHRRMQNH